MHLIKNVLFLVFFAALHIAPVNADDHSPILIGLTAEFGVQHSHSAQSIEKGIELAINEINSKGGVLNGRKLSLITKDDRGVPARGIDNFKAFAGNPAVVAAFSGRFSPVAIEVSKLANPQRLLLLAPWSAADSISQQPSPNYVFRASLIDTWAMNVMLEHAQRKKYKKLALVVPNTAWGRSSEQAFDAHRKKSRRLQHIVLKYNWGDTDFSDEIRDIEGFGADALILVANEAEAVPFVKQIAELPAEKRLPIISHWGILGGDFALMAGQALKKLDLTVVSTFSFAANSSVKAKKVADSLKRLYQLSVNDLHAQVGFAHAYDLTHMLAQAINEAGVVDRAAVRDAFERLGFYQGLVKNYRQPFSKDNHEALDSQQLFMGRFDEHGHLVRIQ